MSTLALPTAGPSRPSLALPSPLPANGLTLPTPLNAATGPNDAGPSNPTLARRQSGVGANATVGAGANGKNRSATPLVELKRSTSPDGHEEDEDDGDDDDDEAAVGTTKRKKGKASGGAAGGAGAGAKKAADGKGDYKYTSEISQMMFVFGEVQDPLPETVKLVEDIVRGQIIEIVTRARLLTHLRSARYLSAEDLIFLIRDDRGKVNRLRTYLSWKDVRKRAKEDEDGDVDPDEPDKAAPKGRKTMVKLPWELLTPFSDFLKTVPSKQGKMGPTANDDEDDEDEDELQAHQDSMQRLKDADEITKKMTKDEYVHYSDCRQASFTYRKSRRFREFINFSAYLDARPNDDIIDILGFLSFEMVRSLCVTALEVRDRLEKSSSGPNPGTAPHPTKKVLTQSKPAKPLPSGHGQGSANSPAVLSSTSPIKRKLTLGEPSTASPHKRVRVDTPGGLVTSPEGDHSSLPRTPAAEGQTTHQTQPSGLFGHNSRKQSGPTAVPVSLFAKPPSARQPLLPSHMLEAFAQIQREEAANRVGSMRNWKGGAMSRGRVALV